MARLAMIHDAERKYLQRAKPHARSTILAHRIARQFPTCSEARTDLGRIPFQSGLSV